MDAASAVLKQTGAQRMGRLEEQLQDIEKPRKGARSDICDIGPVQLGEGNSGALAQFGATHHGAKNPFLDVRIGRML